MLFGTAQRFLESSLAEGLEQIVERVRVECAKCIVVMGGHKDGDRHSLEPNSFNHLEAVHLRHLYIEKCQIGAFTADRGNCTLTINALADHLDVRVSVQKSPNSPAGDGLIINDHGAQFHW